MKHAPFLTARVRRQIRRQYPEGELHLSVAAYLNVALPKGTAWTTTPTSNVGEKEGARLKALGYRKGWPDLVIIGHAGQGNYIELKAKAGVVSREQLMCHEDLRAAGANVGVCRSLEAVEDALLDWGFRLNATTRVAAP